MEKITYSLYKSNNDSDEFYKQISVFVQDIVKHLKSNFNEYINDYMEYVYANNKESLRSENEYLLEILMIGVFWNEYTNKCITLKKLPENILIKLADLRENESIKKIVDINRGILFTIFLNKSSLEEIKFSMKSYIKLLNYLKATGDYKQEVKRLEMWETYFNSKSDKTIEKILNLSSDFAKYFEKMGKEELGLYTKNVQPFLNNVHTIYKYREDYLFCSRKEVEYHLNMVSAEIMNKAYRKEFLKTKEKRLLLPACMRFKNEYNCKAQKTNEGYICANCTESCNVNKYDKLGKKYNFQVYIIPHESSISIKRKFEYGEVGIIGVACVLNLISGGLKAKNLGFVPQCVFLDYCGCKAHWHEEGIITDINEKLLLYSFGIK